MRTFGVVVAILLVFMFPPWHVDMFILHPILIFSNNWKYDRLYFLMQLSIQTDKEITTIHKIRPFTISLPSHQYIQSYYSSNILWNFMTPYNTLLHSPLGKFKHSSNTIALPFKMTVWWFHTLLIPICRLTFATLVPYTIQYLLQSYNLAICILPLGETIQYIDQLKYVLSFRKISP